ncbi:MAG TPA: hypothetical protein VGM53_18840 [Streptosporangiaceae bacterium]
MIETQIRALFAEIADSTQTHSQVDVRLARNRGRARLRWRRACIAGTSGLAAATVVALVVAGPLLPGSGRAASGPAAPRQFSPLAPYLTAGWLPARYQLTAGDTGLREMTLVAQSSVNDFLEVDAFAAGQCTFTGPAGPGGKLKCAGDPADVIPDSIVGRAPAIGGHGAFWRGRDSKDVSSLVWQYARGGWAALRFSGTIGDRAEAVRIADHARFGAATPPLLFPLQLTGLPKTWEVGNVYYRPHHKMLRAARFSLTTGTRHVNADGGLTFQKGLPAFDWIQSASPHQQPCGDANETINGYKVNFYDQHNKQDLCVLNDNGLAFDVGVPGAHPPIGVISLFTGHIRVLGTNPANWTTKPIG